MPLPEVSGANRRTSQSGGSRAGAADREHEQQAPGARQGVRGPEQAVPRPVGGLEGETEGGGDEAGEHPHQRRPGDDPAPPLLAAVEVADLAPDVAGRDVAGGNVGVWSGGHVRRHGETIWQAAPLGDPASRSGRVVNSPGR